MNTIRINQIIESLKNVGPQSDCLYTTQEAIDRCVELQEALKQGLFEKNHAENMQPRDLQFYFDKLAAEYGLEQTEYYKRFSRNMSTLGYTIATYIKGMKGEHLARRALKLLSYDERVELLYNIQLEDDEARAEYDAIAVTPYGLFVIEVKNWSMPMTIMPNGLLHGHGPYEVVYDLPGRMAVKEALLREVLGDLFMMEYRGILLLSNERAQVQDDYKKIPVCVGSGISYLIKEYEGAAPALTSEQIKSVADRIKASHKIQTATCEVRSDEIIADYAMLMAQIEEASSACAEEECQEIASVMNEVDSEKREVQMQGHETERAAAGGKASQIPWWKRIRIGEVAASIALLALPGAVTLLVGALRK